jgi:4-amino-4-deoxy-L-arabinose transferase-like glycosyltransferase
VFAALVALGAALRAVVLVAYHPALIFPDSVRYLQYAHNFTTGHWSADALRQSGYSVLIIPVVLLHDLWLIPLAQHLVGLATAVLVYAVAIRFGVPRWLAAVGSIPVLFDPLQLVLEQYVLTDVWTAFAILAALVILVWRREGPGKLASAACGLLLGLAVTFRDQDLIMIVPAVLYLLVAVRPWRRLLIRMAALAGCFLVPVAGYLGWFDASHGQWNFTTFSGAFLYGRVADFASCEGLNLPGYERPLCPAQPPAQRNADFYTWNPRSPQWTFQPPAGMSRDAVVRDFSLRILRHQPLAYTEAVGRDFLYGFAPSRGAGPEQYSPAYLQFHTYVRPDRQAYASIAALGYPAPALRPGPAAFLTGYGRWFHVPGPVFAAGLVIALGGVIAGKGRRAARDAGLLFTVGAVLVLLPPAAFATFDWRYQLPQLSLIPVAALLGVKRLSP